MHTSYYYDSPDGRRARMTVINKVDLYRVRLVIRSDRGHGPVLMNRTYTTRSRARRALSRRGDAWHLFKTSTF